MHAINADLCAKAEGGSTGGDAPTPDPYGNQAQDNTSTREEQNKFPDTDAMGSMSVNINLGGKDTIEAGQEQVLPKVPMQQPIQLDLRPPAP